MADLEAIEVLTQAKERLFECGWGRFTSKHRPDPNTLCLEEAILGKQNLFVNCSGNYSQRRAVGYINTAVDRAPSDSVFSWNDRQESAGPVFDAIDRAIEIAKEAPNPAS